MRSEGAVLEHRGSVQSRSRRCVRLRLRTGRLRLRVDWFLVEPRLRGAGGRSVRLTEKDASSFRAISNSGLCMDRAAREIQPERGTAGTPVEQRHTVRDLQAVSG